MGLISDKITNTIYNNFPGVKDLEDEIQKLVEEGKKVKESINRIFDFSKKAGDYINSGQPLKHLDDALNNISNNIHKTLYKPFKQAFDKIKQDFNNIYNNQSGATQSPAYASSPASSTIISGSRPDYFESIKPNKNKSYSYSNSEVSQYNGDQNNGGGGVTEEVMDKGTSKNYQAPPQKSMTQKATIKEEKQSEEGGSVNYPKKEPYQNQVAPQPVQAKPLCKPVCKEDSAMRGMEDYSPQQRQPERVLTPSNETSTTQQKSVEKPLTLDSIVEEFKRNLKKLSPDIDAEVDVYAPGGLLRTYECRYVQRKAVEDVVVEGTSQNKGVLFTYSDLESKFIHLGYKYPGHKHLFKKGLDNLFSKEDKKAFTSGTNYYILELYNKGYKTKDIVKEASTKGYQVRNYKDVINNVASAIASGAAYVRSKFNSLIASALGAVDQLITDYLSGKSYAEIKENLRQRTNGMNVSDSSILRIMHNYENKTGNKVVGVVKRRNARANQGKQGGVKVRSAESNTGAKERVENKAEAVQVNSEATPSQSSHEAQPQTQPVTAAVAQ